MYVIGMMVSDVSPVSSFQQISTWSRAAISAMEQPAPRVRQDDLLIGRAQDIGAFSHEMDAAEQNIFCILLLGGPLGQFVRIAPNVSKLDDFVALIVVPEDHQARAQAFSEFPDSPIGFVFGQTCQVFW